MLAIKRALSILLTSLLAMPPMAMAKLPKSSKQLAQRKSAVTAVRPRPAVRVGDHRLPLLFRGKEAYSVTATRGKGKKLRTRTVSGPEYTQTLVDENSDGYVDVVKIERGSITTIASEPYRGQFRRIDVERKMTKGVYKAKLLLSFDRTKYEMIEQNVSPYGTVSAEATGSATSQPRAQMESGQSALDAIMNGGPFDYKNQKFVTEDRRFKNECETAIVLDSLSALDRALNEAHRRTGMPIEEVIACQLNKFQSVLYDRSCFTDASSAWQNSLSTINAAFARVMASHYDGHAGGHNENSRYLHCLDDNGFTAASTGARQHVFDRIRDMSAALMNAGLTSADVAAAFADVRSCAPLAEVSSPDGARRVDLRSLNERLNQQQSKPAIACNRPDGAHRGQFRNGTIHLFYPLSQVTQHTPNCGPGCTPTDAYASTLFHELVHASGFDDRQEELVRNVEKCCAPMTGSPRDAVACSSVRSSARALALRQRVEADMSTFLPDYNIQSAITGVSFHPHGNAMLDEWRSGVAEVVERTWSPELKARFEACGTNQTCKDQVAAPIKARVETVTREFFRDRCPAYAATVNSPSANCSSTGEAYVSLLNGRGGIYERSTTGVEPRGFSGVVQGLGERMDAEDFRALAPQAAVVEVAPPAVIGAVELPSVSLVERLPITINIDDLVVPEIPQFTVEEPETLTPARTTARTSSARAPRAAAPQAPEAAQPVPQAVSIPRQPAPQAPSTTTTIAGVSPPASTGTSARDYATFGTRQQSPTPTGTTTTRAPSPSPTASRPAPAYSSGIEMPSATNGTATLGVAGGRADGIASTQTLPISGAVESAVNRVTTAVASVGQAVVAATTPQAQAAQERIADSQPSRPAPGARQPASSASTQQPFGATSQSAQSGQAALSVGLRSANSFGSFPTNSNFSQPVRMISQGENPLVPAGSRRVQAGSAAERAERARAAARGDRTQRDGPASASAASAGGPRAAVAEGDPASVDGSNRATAGNGDVEEGEVAGDEASVARRNKPGPKPDRVVASTQSPAERVSARTRYRTIQDATTLQSYISRIDYTSMGSYLNDREFVQKIRSVGVAIRGPNGRVGAPPPAPLMEACPTRQRYVLEGTCR